MLCYPKVPHGTWMDIPPPVVVTRTKIPQDTTVQTPLAMEEGHTEYGIVTPWTKSSLGQPLLAIEVWHTPSLVLPGRNLPRTGHNYLPDEISRPF